MASADDRRAPDAARIPFEAMVEVGGALGPSFEAQAVNLSEDGMHLRTAYLPEVGQPVMCRFDAGQGLEVVAAGEVLWKEDMGDGGEFGIRFTNLDSPSTVALQRILGMAEDGLLVRGPMGRKVRLHIEGLASPMRARVRDTHGGSVTAYSELGFLQVGKGLELEDANSGDKRPASIDRVAVEIEPETHIPQLVVTLRYEDQAGYEGRMMDDRAPVGEGDHTGRDGSMEPMVMEDEPMDATTSEAGHDDHAPHVASAKLDVEHAGMDEESKKLKGAFARGAAKVTPALEKWMKRAKTTVALLAARRKGGSGDDLEIPIRRTTAPPPGGALHASGRKVVRGEIGEEMKMDAEPELDKPRFKVTKKKAVVAGTIGIATILAIVALRRPAPAPEASAAPPVDPAAAAAAGAPAQPPPTPATTAGGHGLAANDPLATAAMAQAGDPMMSGGKPGKVMPFGNGPVGAHGVTLKLKMDGAIDRIEGASQPTGFTVVIPGRKSLDAAGPLAAKDSRIAAIQATNGAGGAELALTFKDGVPNYQVRAHKDTLEIVLARQPAEAKATGGGKKHKKH